MQLINNESKVIVTKEQQRNSDVLMQDLRQGVTSYIQRQLRRKTTLAIPDRKFHRRPAAPLPVIVPSANDPEGIFNSDPLFLAGKYWALVPHGKRATSELFIAGWVRGHV